MPKIFISYSPLGTRPYKSFAKIHDYLYEVSYDRLNYDIALKWYAAHGDVDPFGCSSVRSGNWYGRNYDWVYNHDAEFIVHTPHTDEFKACVGVCGSLKPLTKEFVEKHTPAFEYLILPFQMYDGINEDGVFASMNVVPTDHGINKSVPEVETRHEISSRMMIRFILDRFSSATEAVEYIRDYVSIYFTKDLHKLHYEIHFMIGDSNSLYILEIVDGATKIIDAADKPMMTNFYISGVEFNSDGTVYTPETQTDSKDAIKTNKVTENGCGLERYNAIVGMQPTADSQVAMRNLMRNIRYSRSYNTYSDPAEPAWNTEFVGINNLICNSPLSEFEVVQGLAGEAYLHRDRNKGNVWQTMHSSVYDIINKELYIVVQEDFDNEYKFTI